MEWLDPENSRTKLNTLTVKYPEEETSLDSTHLEVKVYVPVPPSLAE